MFRLDKTGYRQEKSLCFATALVKYGIFRPENYRMWDTQNPSPVWFGWFCTANHLHFIRARTTSQHGPSTGEIWVYTTTSILAEPIMWVSILFLIHKMSPNGITQLIRNQNIHKITGDSRVK